MVICNTNFTRDSGAADIGARAFWCDQAIVVSPKLLSTTPGIGTAYLAAFRDAENNELMGKASYKLTLRAPPAKRFWAVMTHASATRGLLASDGAITVGTDTNPVINVDGSVDLYFGQSGTERFEQKPETH